MKQLLLIGFGGFLGSIARYLVSKLNLSWSFHSIPMGTLTANLLGSLLIGFFVGFLVNTNELNTNLKLFLIVGFCGGFTTFSAFSFENFQLLQNGQIATAIIYTTLSIVLGVSCVVGGFYLSKLITP